MADDELKVNTVERFSKRSPNLVLEEHGHCEVPAGCGGVVLQWRDARKGLLLYLQAVGSFSGAETFIDGEPLSAHPAELDYGAHQLAVRLLEVEEPRWFVWETSAKAPKEDESKRPLPSLSSAADGSWKATMAPGIDCMRTEYDDSAWVPLPEAPDLGRTLAKDKRWRYDYARKKGEVVLRLPGTGEVWIRKQLVVRRELGA